MRCLNFLALLLIVIGALNWGLWGFFQFDLVAWLCHGNTNWLARVIYSLVGLAGVLGLGFISKSKVLCCSRDHDKDQNSGGGCCKM